MAILSPLIPRRPGRQPLVHVGRLAEQKETPMSGARGALTHARLLSMAFPRPQESKPLSATLSLPSHFAARPACFAFLLLLDKTAAGSRPSPQLRASSPTLTGKTERKKEFYPSPTPSPSSCPCSCHLSIRIPQHGPLSERPLASAIVALDRCDQPRTHHLRPPASRPSPQHSHRRAQTLRRRLQAPPSCSCLNRAR